MNDVETLVSENDLLLYPEIQWDRFGRDYAYGWIKRDDGRFDFACLTYNLVENKPGEVRVSIITSSAKYSKDFALRLGCKEEDYQNCIRVESNFDIPNKIVLLKKG